MSRTIKDMATRSVKGSGVCPENKDLKGTRSLFSTAGGLSLRRGIIRFILRRARGGATTKRGNDKGNSVSVRRSGSGG